MAYCQSRKLTAPFVFVHARIEKNRHYMKTSHREVKIEEMAAAPLASEKTLPASHLIVLYQADKDIRMRVKKITGIRQLRLQLAQMGIHVGDTLKVKRRVPFGGAILVEHRGAMLAISKGFAEQITVEIIA
jgi:Fe2+ transport system protein FeoA